MNDWHHLSEMMSHLSSAAHWIGHELPQLDRIIRRLDLAKRSARRIKNDQLRIYAIRVLQGFYKLSERSGLES